VQPTIILAAVGLVVFASFSSIGSLQRTQWVQAVPASEWAERAAGLAAHLRHAHVVELGRSTAPAGAIAFDGALPTGSTPGDAAAIDAPFACVAPVPEEKTIPAMVRRYKHPQSGLMFMTFTNKDRFDFGITWAYRLCRLGLPHFAIGALDAPTLTKGNGLGLPMFQMGEHDLGATDYGWNTPRFKLMGQDKVQLLIDVLKANATAVLMDADAVLVNDPVPFFDKLPDAEVLVPTDFTALGAMDGGLEDVRVSDHVMNIGIVYAKPSALPFAVAWREYLRTHVGRWDQTVFNEMIKVGWGCTLLLLALLHVLLE
jgi:hypothetical protein